ncbi:M14 family zinc carboxypeptidase [Hyunsoonleella ulvae]|uniref:M14 family zinc carboxypeptidase n=1 Tax=Hyunsoonleella ulvae TaxID=2799948 RepID=UPI001939BBDF|nr:M14 family zinc carboxypeptidase [Hyunsoonleella ulvae]
MEISDLQLLFKNHKELSLFHRYITNEKIVPLLSRFKTKAKVEIVGKSVLENDIYSIKIGNGNKRILMWSQMHGNESTTTKAIFDFLNLCISESDIANKILDSCTLCIIPILNPDGAEVYTRVNANAVDLNRDAQSRAQPESVILRKVFESFKPHFCYNLHGQRTIFSAGNTNKSATISFLAPAQDKECTITPTRKIAMEVIAEMNSCLQKIIPEQVGVYDDAFNINCVGDTFQTENVPTILFEAGHFHDDYARDITRELIFISYLTSLYYISTNNVEGKNYAAYLDIPENKKLFFDVIIRKARLQKHDKETVDLAFQFEERLREGKIEFIPILKKIDGLSDNYAHNQIDAEGSVISNLEGKVLEIDSENVFVKLNNKEIALFSK